MPTTEQIAIIALAGVILLLLGYIVGGRGRARQAGKGELPPVALPVALPPGAEALAPAFTELRGQLSELRGKLEEVRTASAEVRSLQGEERQRWSREDAAYTSLQRLSAVLLGSATAGAAGERLVQEALGSLPPQWLVTDHKVANQPVEFAVRLPDGLFLPIDSKVVAQSELDALEHAETPARRAQLEKNIRDEALKRAKEVHKYVDARSPGFAIAAVPDAAYRLSGAILPRAYQEHQVLLVPYSMLAPFVLMVYEQHRRGGVDLNNERMAALLSEAENHVERASLELNGRISNAVTMLANGRDDLKRELDEAARTLSLLRAGSQDGTPSAAKK